MLGSHRGLACLAGEPGVDLLRAADGRSIWSRLANISVVEGIASAELTRRRGTMEVGDVRTRVGLMRAEHGQGVDHSLGLHPMARGKDQLEPGVTSPLSLETPFPGHQARRWPAGALFHIAWAWTTSW
jgi:hypothetical protein